MYRSMKKGDYVRRVTRDGYTTGPYMQVQLVSGGVVYCDVVGLDEPNIAYEKKRLKVIPHTSVCVSEEVLMCLKSGRQSVVSHPMCKRWFDVWEKQPRLITFYCTPKNYKYTFVIEKVYSFQRNGKITVKIVISNKL